MNNQNITRKAFDYNGKCPDKETRAFLRGQETAIRAAHRRVQNDIIEIGQHLLDTKERVAHGLLMEWVEDALGYTYRHATSFMQVAQTFGKMELNSTLPLSQTAIFALAAPSVDDETRTVALELAASGDLKTTADARAVIDAGKPIVPSNPHPLQSTDLEDDEFPTPPEYREEGEDDADYFDDSDPFADEDAESGEAPKSKAEESLNPSNSTGLNSAQETPAPLSIEEQIESLPLAQALDLYGHKGHIFRQQAAIYLDGEKALGKFRHAVQGAIRHTKGPVSEAFKTVIGIPHPSDWEGCASCKGSLRVGERMNPCGLCNGNGFTTRKGEGVSADVVEQHAKSL